MEKEHMREFMKKHKLKMIIGFAIFCAIPIVIKYITMLPGLSTSSNDWVGFWGSYIGAILGACVAMYVLTETLADNKRTQTREELVAFCNCITEKISLFAQKYEETMYVKELLDEMRVENRWEILSLKEIYNCAKRNKDTRNETDIVEYYMDIFRKEIGSSRSKLLVYKNRMNRKTDLEIPVFWMSTLAVILANVSTFVAILNAKTDYVTQISEMEATAVFVVIMIMGVTLYQVSMKERKKYSLMRLALEEIGREMGES